MRTIKFRAWDGKRYFYDVMVGNGHISWGGYQWFQCDQGLAIEQFTGLLDKNGKEIYEGDIVRHVDTKRGWLVSFQHGAFVRTKETQDAVRLKIDWPEDLVVIGNIHENAELLK